MRKWREVVGNITYTKLRAMTAELAALKTLKGDISPSLIEG